MKKGIAILTAGMILIGGLLIPAKVEASMILVTSGTTPCVATAYNTGSDSRYMTVTIWSSPSANATSGGSVLSTNMGTVAGGNSISTSYNLTSIIHAYASAEQFKGPVYESGAESRVAKIVK